MKKILVPFLLILLSLSAFGQVGSQSVSGIKYRVNDSATYISAVATAHAQGYADIFWNNQASTPHFDVWNGSAYEHVFVFGGSGSGTGLVDGDYGDITVGGTGTTMTVDNLAITNAKINDVAVGKITGLGTGIVTALGINVGSAGSPVVNGGALGTPSSGTGTNITGIVGTNVTNTPAGNIAATTAQAAINELDAEKETKTPRVQTVASTATLTPDINTYEAFRITAQASGLTIANPTGTMNDMQQFVIAVKDNGTARAISFGTKYRVVEITLPTTTVLGKRLFLQCIVDAADDKIDVIAIVNEI